METGALYGTLEVRRGGGGGARLSGSFPYNTRAVLSDGGRNGRPRKEEFAPGAFGHSVDDPAQEIHLLVGHSFDRPLASQGAGSLILRDTDKALIFTATIAPALLDAGYVRDTLAAIEAGLIGGISPGFRLPPQRAVPEAEVFEDEGHDPENGAHNAIIRTIREAILFELSLVTRPAYKETELQLREENRALPARPAPHLARWRL